eukprot:4508672-Prymnesium_polylepis.1
MAGSPSSALYGTPPFQDRERHHEQQPEMVKRERMPITRHGHHFQSFRCVGNHPFHAPTHGLTGAGAGEELRIATYRDISRHAHTNPSLKPYHTDGFNCEGNRRNQATGPHCDLSSDKIA